MIGDDDKVNNSSNKTNVSSIRNSGQETSQLYITPQNVSYAGIADSNYSNSISINKFQFQFDLMNE